jgi:hypothetical protein
MKSLFAFLILFVLLASAAGQQSLGDVARDNRNKKKPTSAIRLDDDNMPRKAPPEAEEKKEQDKAVARDKDAAAKDDKNAKNDSPEAQKSKSDQLVKAVQTEKDEIARLRRELDILEREQKLRAAAYYGDAGTMLRDSAKFTEDSKKQQADIDSKKQALDAAQQKLADLEEQARKAGLGSSATE